MSRIHAAYRSVEAIVLFSVGFVLRVVNRVGMLNSFRRKGIAGPEFARIHPCIAH